MQKKTEIKCSILVILVHIAAFDTEDHHPLLCDQENLDPTGFALSWFKICLTDIRNEVIVNDEESEIGSMRHEAPQGITSAPVLFIIYAVILQYFFNCCDVSPLF